MKNIPFTDVSITGGYWHERQRINREVTEQAVYDRFAESGRFDALKCEWKEGDPNLPHIFWDSDVAKWIEGAAYLLETEQNDTAVEIIETVIDRIIEHRDEHGYFNSHFLVTEQDKRFQMRDCHELYCAGHLIEAAVAYYHATGKDRFLKVMCKFADYIEQVFKIEKSAAFTTPGHPELELALMKLAEATGEQRYADLAKFFIDEHGCHPEETTYAWAHGMYNQDEMPIRERSTAEGHSVRALYLMSGAADVAYAYHDDELKAACERVFENIVNRRMYVTGGVGSTHLGEAFTVDYDLPNRTAYAETCAAISLAMFAGRMLRFGADSKYADIVERTIYNGVMSGVSMDGKAFFYENPLEIDPDFNNVNTSTEMKERLPITQRLELFECSCCPPNILRFVASIGGYAYGEDDDIVYIHQYVDSTLSTEGSKLTVNTRYPADGTICVNVESDKKQLALRIPGWCKSFTLNREYTLKNGYAYVNLDKSGEIVLELAMPVCLIAANRKVHASAGRVAVMRGPVVYCAEGVDNGSDLATIAIDKNAEFTVTEGEFLLPNLTTTATRPQASEALYEEVCEQADEELPLTLIPYYAFANRGESAMQVWLLKK